jgi:TPR repeat protein
MKAIEALLPSARSGDAKAALAIYSKLFSCRPEVDDSVIRSGIRAGEDDQQIAGHLANHREECAGTADLLLERGRWLEAAAASGLPEAQLLYATDMEAIVGTREQIIRNPEKLMRYKARSSGYLKELAATGNVDAMLALSSVYEHGTLVEQDPVRSYAYGRAAQLAIPSVIPHDMLDRQRATLSPEHLAEGERLGRIIHSTCCNTPRKEP